MMPSPAEILQNQGVVERSHEAPPMVDQASHPNFTFHASSLLHSSFPPLSLIQSSIASSSSPSLLSSVPLRAFEASSTMHRSSTSSWPRATAVDNCENISNSSSHENDSNDAVNPNFSRVGSNLSVGAMRMKKVKARRKVREPRFCFKTMSDVDVLDDGYKWRKYGQKVVKNTQHPRSYYRCTQDNCRVKKRVERLAEDPRMVITTYEGRHAHSPSHDEDDQMHPSWSTSHLNTSFFW